MTRRSLAGRRYGLCALIGVAPGEPDDDGAAAMPTTPTPAQDRSLPDGFEVFWASLHAAASEGLPALEQAWREGDRLLKEHVVAQHREAWTALKALAQSGNGRAR